MWRSIMYKKHKLFYVIALVLVLVCWFVFKSKTVLITYVDLQYVVVHLDLKGAPPKLKYLEYLLPTLKYYGVSGILMEYEDMFPYEGRLVNLSATNCYKRQELKTFVTKAHNTGVQIIPLVQTFGHLEHALKLEEFMHLREMVMKPMDICPSKPESQKLIKDMLEQVITFHSSVVPLKHIHVGCDEVYYINQCVQCRQRKLEHTDLFLKHVQMIQTTVKTLSPKTKVLMWDDMLSNIKQPLQTVKLDLSNIEPVCWNYRPNVEVSHANLYNYHKIFNNIWVASAFKGADGKRGVLPKLKERFLNNLEWLRLMSNYKFGGEDRIYNFKGIILTGWSRYSHMAPLCELLPASMPSLILNLLLIRRVRKGIDFDDLQNMNICDFYDKYLKTDFEKKIQSSNDNNNKCSFENNTLYEKLNKFLDFEFESYLKEHNEIQLDEYNFKMGNIDLKAVKNGITILYKALKQYAASKKGIKNYMSQYYENDVIEEYLHDKIYIYERDVTKRIKILLNYSEIPFWRRRPPHHISKSYV